MHTQKRYKMEVRIDKDSLGEVKVPVDKYWGAQTQRALLNFNIHDVPIPSEIIDGLAIAKKAAAFANEKLKVLATEKKELIAQVCDEILLHQLTDHFPLSVWQTGSGTQVNMNINEVIAHRGEFLKMGKIGQQPTFLSPNDDVNQSQSTNDIFPTATRIAIAKLIKELTIPALQFFIQTLQQKVTSFQDIIKVGRTHLTDATPISLGQEFSAFQSQLTYGLEALERSLPHLMQLPIGGTAIGTGLNAPPHFDTLAVQYINQFTGLSFQPSPNKFEATASHDAMVEVSGALKQLAVSLMKISNDIRILSSGPRCGIGEITLPANEPGSSIMPGKVNPTQCEALSVVCCQIIGNDVAVTTGGMSGILQLNVFMPLMSYNVLQSAKLLGEIAHTFTHHCLIGIEANQERIEQHLHHSLMLVTALNSEIGYNKAAEVAQFAYNHNITLKEAVVQLQLMTEEKFDQLIDPKKMI